MQLSPSHHLPMGQALQCPTGSADFPELELSYTPLQESLQTCLGLSCRNRFPRTERAEMVSCRLQTLSRKLTVATLGDKHGWPDVNLLTVLCQHESFLAVSLVLCFVVVQSLSHIRLCTTWMVARQAPLSMGSSRQEHWSGLPCPPPRDLPDPGIASPALVLSGKFFAAEPSGKSILCQYESFLVVSFVIYCYLLQYSKHLENP